MTSATKVAASQLRHGCWRNPDSHAGLKQAHGYLALPPISDFLHVAAPFLIAKCLAREMVGSPPIPNLPLRPQSYFMNPPSPAQHHVAVDVVEGE